MIEELIALGFKEELGHLVHQNNDTECNSKNFLSKFAIEDIVHPLSLHQQERLADTLVKKIKDNDKLNVNDKDPYLMPDYLEEFRQKYDGKKKLDVQLPIVSQLTPRTKRKINLLPKPNEHELSKVREIERTTKKLSAETIYSEILKSTNKTVQNTSRSTSPVTIDFGTHSQSSAYDHRDIDGNFRSIDQLPEPILQLPRSDRTQVVNNKAADYFQYIEQYRRKKVEQKKKLEKLFGHKQQQLSQTLKNNHLNSTLINNGVNMRPNTTSLARQESSKTILINSNSDAALTRGKSVANLINDHVEENISSIRLNRSPSRITSQNSFKENNDKVYSHRIQSVEGDEDSVEESAQSPSQPVSRMSLSHSQLKKMLSASSIFSTSQGNQSGSSGYELLLSTQPPTHVNDGSAPSSAGHHPRGKLVSKPSFMTKYGLKPLTAGKDSSANHETQSAASKVVDPKHKEFLQKFSVRVHDELHIDLDKIYNKFHHFTVHLQIFAYHFYMCRLRAAISRWRAQTLLMRRQFVRKVLKRVMLVVKIALHIKALQEKANFLRIQMQMERKRFYENQMYINQRARMIARAVRRRGKLKHIRELLTLRRAATKIQKIFRGRKARKKVVNMRLALIFINSRAKLIQQLYRRRIAWRKEILMRKLVFVEDYLQELAQRRSKYKENFLLNGAQAYIASAYRTFQLRKNLHEILYWHRYSKAIVIQRVYRGYCIRRYYRDYQRRQEIQARIFEQNAVIIQKYVRRYLAGLLLEEMRDRQDELNKIKFQMKLLKLKHAQQRWNLCFRCTRATQRVMLKTVPLYAFFHRKFVREKATLIQRVFRGHHVRKRMLFIRARAWLEKDYSLRKRQKKSATLIQRVFRGHRARELIKRRKREFKALIIQCAFRMYSARQRLKRQRQLNRHAKNLTKLLRRQIKKHVFHVQFKRVQKLREVVIPIQNWMRRCLARKRLREKISAGRRQKEQLLYQRVQFSRLLLAVQLRILQDTIPKAIQQKYYTVSKVDCLCYSPLQALFVLGICGNTSASSNGNSLSLSRRNRQDLRALNTNKVDSSALIKFFNRVVGATNLSPSIAINNFNSFQEGQQLREQSYLAPTLPKTNNENNPATENKAGAMKTSNNNTSAMNTSALIANIMSKAPKSTSNLNNNNNSNNSSKSMKKTGKKIFQSTSALLNALYYQDINLPAIEHTLNANEIDLIFAKCKNARNVSNKLNYQEFLDLLNVLGHLQYNFHAAKSSGKAGFERTLSSLGAEQTIANTATQNPQNTSVEESLLAVSNAELVETDSSAVQNAETDAVTSAEKSDSADAVENAQEEDEREEEEMHDDEALFAPALQNALTDSGAFNIHKFVEANVKILNFKAKLFTARTIKVPSIEQAIYGIESAAMTAEKDYRLLYLLRILYSFRHEEYVQLVCEWLEIESRSRLGLFATKIQTVVRRRIAVRRTQELRVERIEFYRREHKVSMALRIQRSFRGFLWRTRVRLLAQKFFVKYVPILGDAYYYNPVTTLKSWEKPKLLGPLECYSVAVPDNNLENVIFCFDCQCSKAEIYCNSCEESMCQNCFETLHCKGQRRNHTSSKIPICAYCKFQCATKSCVTCIIQRPRAGHIKESISPADRGTFCDSCFMHEHNQHVRHLQATDKKQTRDQIKTLFSHSRQAFLLKHYLAQKLSTRHHFDQLTQVCEECNVYSASWRCVPCRQVYCHRCLISFHGINPTFAKHQIEQLPYYTPAMHTNFKRDLATQEFKQQIARVKLEVAKYWERQQYKQVVRIQAWWRMHYYAKRGKRFMRRKRRVLRQKYRQRRDEDKLVRATLSFQIRQYLGLAPALKSDTREEIVLRRLPEWQREKARAVIARNVDDWYYSNKFDERAGFRKGQPRRGFDVGKVQELVDQAHRLGLRLPGRVFVKHAQQEFAVTHDLRKIARPGEIIRIRDRLFVLVRVNKNSIRVNRRWRDRESKRVRRKTEHVSGGFTSLSVEDAQDEDEADEDERSLMRAIDGDDSDSDSHSHSDSSDDEEKRSRVEGEVMYRMPTYRNEEGRRVIRARLLAYDLTIDNPLTQMVLVAYQAICQQLMRFSVYMMQANRRSEDFEHAFQWKNAALGYSRKAKWAASFLSTGEHLIDLSGVDLDQLSPDEIERRKRMKRRGGLLEEEENEDLYANLRSGRSGAGDSDEFSALIHARKSLKPETAHSKRMKEQKVVAGEDQDPLEQNFNFDYDLETKALLVNNQLTSDMQQLGDENSQTSDPYATLLGAEKSTTKKHKTAKRKVGGGSSSVDGSLASARSRRQALAGQSNESAVSTKSVNSLKSAEKNLKKKRQQKVKRSDKPWFATAEEEVARREREEKMTLQELAAEAGDWKECVDPLTENIYYLNIHTNEQMNTVPRAIQAKRQLDFENMKTKKSYDEAQKRIARLELVTKQRMMISGKRKR